MTYSEDSVGISRARVWIGLLAVVVGCYLAGDAEHRALVALEFGARWWPWALLGLAVINLLRSALPAGALIGPLLLAVVAAIGLSWSGHISMNALASLILPGLLAIGGAALVLATPSGAHRSSWTRVLATGEVVVPGDVRGTVTVRAILGDLRADLTGSADDEGITVHVTAIAGHVRMAVPRDRPVRVHSSGTVLTRVAESGRKPTASPSPSASLTVHVLGICGTVDIVRL